jgi:monoamine oxidase
MSKKTKIVIVGAGAAGIAAASKLLKNGLNDFVILEANNRIGGRIHTVNFGKYCISYFYVVFN